MNLWRRIYREQSTVVVPSLVLLLVGAAIFGLGVFPLSANVASLQGDAQNASTGLLRARLLEKQAKDASGSKTRADEELHKFYGEILPANATGARRVMSFLERTAEADGLRFEHSQLEESEVKDSQLLRMTGKVTLVGEYPNIRKFLYSVETAEEFVVVESVGLSQTTDLRSANSVRLEVTLDVATYYLPNSGLPPR